MNTTCFLYSPMMDKENLKIQSAKYISSYADAKKCPTDGRPEFAFIGRSNVGKSSLINLLCNRKDLVHTSNSPGKTRTINYFLINDWFYFVDLPGYGYAKVSQETRRNWQQMIKDYLTGRDHLFCVFLLIDARLEPQPADLEFANHLGEWQVPFVLVFTKTDKNGSLLTSQHIQLFEKEMKKSWETLPHVFQTSAVDKSGREEVLHLVEKSLSGKV